jgi:hypothetical protein
MHLRSADAHLKAEVILIFVEEECAEQHGEFLR